MKVTEYRCYISRKNNPDVEVARFTDREQVQAAIKKAETPRELFDADKLPIAFDIGEKVKICLEQTYEDGIKKTLSKNKTITREDLMTEEQLQQAELLREINEEQNIQ